MSFSGTITESNGMTMTRLIERIVHTDTPGELRLLDESSGRRAVVAIRRGMVQEVAFGELKGDPALTAISQAMPWTFEFVADEAGAMPSHPSMISRRPKGRAVLKKSTPPRVEEPAEEPVPSPLDSEPAAEPEAPPDPAAPWTPGLTPAHRQWLTDTGYAHYCIRFGTAGQEFAGAIQAEDYDYFRSDFGFLSATAAAIAQSLGWGSPSVIAISEAERSTGYQVIEGGFLGIMAGAGGGVRHVIDFPEVTAP
jgi:hypothetical protein